MAETLSFHPLTADRWDDFETLFGANGACGGCWCMFWRVPRPGYLSGTRAGGKGNKAAMKKIVKRGPPPGLLAYEGKTVIGWIALAPRETYLRLQGSRILKPVDAQSVWSAPCFFVAKAHRRRGLSVALLNAAADYARLQGVSLLEGYPVDADKRQPDAFMYTGLAGAFEKAGFKEAARRSPKRPVMRRALRG